MRDLRSLARRVRGYVSSNKRLSTATAKENPTAGTTMRSSERKALATLGRRGGKKAAERWKDPESDYAKVERAKLAAANKRRKAAGGGTRARILAAVSETFSVSGRMPTWREIAEEVGVSRRTVAYHLAALRESGMLPE